MGRTCSTYGRNKEQKCKMLIGNSVVGDMHRQECNKTLVWDVCTDRRVIKRITRKWTYGAEWIHCSVRGFSEYGAEPIGFMNAGSFLAGWRTIHNSRNSSYYTLHFLDFTNRCKSLPSSVQHLRALRMSVPYSMWFWCFHNHLSSSVDSRYVMRLFLLMYSWVPCLYGMALPQLLHGQDGLRWG
jgi:hypothetical protein